MDRGSGLTAADRLHIRRTVTKLLTWYPDGGIAAERVKEYYSGCKPFVTYALAYLGALQTTEPINLEQVRDSRS